MKTNKTRKIYKQYKRHMTANNERKTKRIYEDQWT